MSSCTFGVVGPSGKRLGHQVVETNAQALVAAGVSESRGSKSDKLDASAEPRSGASGSLRGL